jgi:hypothetical protein
MKNKTEFFKLLVIATTCNCLVIIGIVLIDLNLDNFFHENIAGSLGVLILWNTLRYVHQHELKQKIKNMHDNWFVYRYKL